MNYSVWNAPYNLVPKFIITNFIAGGTTQKMER